LRTLIRVAPPFIFMKSSKTSDPKPISLYRALTLPLQAHIPPSTIQQTGARRSEVACTSLRSDPPLNEAEIALRIDVPEEPPNVVWFWVVVVNVVAEPATVVVETEVVVITVVVVEVVVAVAVIVVVDVAGVVAVEVVVV
jgi:hypothetical protein